MGSGRRVRRTAALRRIRAEHGPLGPGAGERAGAAGLAAADSEYVARRTAQGMSKKDIIRCLKRFVAREVSCPEFRRVR